MNQLRVLPALTVVLAAIPTAASCSNGSGSPGQTLHGVSSASTPAVASSDAAALCGESLTGDDLLASASGTVAQFQQFQYGGPTPTRPLASAFLGLAEDTAGAWCAVKVGTETTRWFAVVKGRGPVKAIDITGPGEGTTGVQGPPVVP